MKHRYPQVRFAGRQEGEALLRHYASADVFVMPSRTETFGLVLLEALACGLPVAALPVPGPLDVIGDSGVGVLDWDLRAAALQALAIPSEICRAHALRFSWHASIQQFLGNLVPGADGSNLSEQAKGTAISSCDGAERFASTPCP
jgi:glycosyltransferase involved in cell wall biosynthesis